MLVAYVVLTQLVKGLVHTTVWRIISNHRNCSDSCGKHENILIDFDFFRLSYIVKWLRILLM